MRTEKEESQELNTNESIPVTANVKVLWRPGQSRGKTTFTVGWADVKDDRGEPTGAVHAKIDGSAEVHILDEGRSRWVFWLSTPELWRIANEALRVAKDQQGKEEKHEQK